MSIVVQKKYADLLESIFHGDKAAEKKLVDTYYKTLFYILFKQTQDHSLTQDLCQDAFLIVLTKARNGEIKNTETIGAFIRSVGVNLLIEFKRKQMRQKTDASDNVEALAVNNNDIVVKDIEKTKALELVQQIIQELPNQRDRQLLRDYFLYGKSKASICQSFDLKTEHFDRVLYRARQRLKQLLALKLNVDISSFTITNIICIALISVCSALFFYSNTKNEKMLGETQISFHYNIIVKAEPDCSQQYICFLYSRKSV